MSKIVVTGNFFFNFCNFFYYFLTKETIFLTVALGFYDFPKHDSAHMMDSEYLVEVVRKCRISKLTDV